MRSFPRWFKTVGEMINIGVGRGFTPAEYKRMLQMLKDTSSVAPRQLPLKGKPKFRKLSLIV